jgi:hypothetical protein
LPNQYATASSGGSCSARGEAGSIDITCEVPEAGILTVQENAFDGWNATVNGEDVSIAPGQQWLTFAIPAGTSSIELRYRPWDFWVGLVLSLGGIGLAIAMLVVPDRFRFHFIWNRRPATAKTAGSGG